MISREDITKGICHPGKAAKYLYRATTRHTVRELNYRLRRVNQRYHRRRDLAGYDVMEADWDTAIILDACRYDTFVECNPFDVFVECKTAIASESSEYFQRTFSNDTFHDTVYVTGNPFITTLDDNTFHDVYLDKAWSDGGEEVPPDRMTNAAVQAHNEHPNKRIIVHYMQPHLPILAPEWTWINDHIEYYKGEWFPTDVTNEQIRAAYRANLVYVLEFVQDLLNAIEGRVLITADHGELVGERQRPLPIRGYNHKDELYIDGLLNVPWAMLEDGPRRDVVAERPVGEIAVNEDKKRDRLEALGYL